MRNTLEFEQYTMDECDLNPKSMDTEIDGHAKPSCLDFYGFLFDKNDLSKKPVMYFRHSNLDEPRFCGIVNFGEGPLVPHTAYHFSDLAQKGNKTVKPYQKVSDNPECYEISSEEPYHALRYYKDHGEAVEGKDGSILNLRLTPLYDWGVKDYGKLFADVITIMCPSYMEGTYEGKEVIGIGSYDRCLMASTDKRDIGDTFTYYSLSGTGVRPDGRIENFTAFLNENGMKFGIYWVQGEERIITEDLKFEADWYHLPYVDDGTCCFKDATITIGPKVIHFNGKWGAKGFMDKPRIDRHGQSQVFGTFYEGDTPYNHSIYMTFGENMEAYDYKLRKAGLSVVD